VASLSMHFQRGADDDDSNLGDSLSEKWRAESIKSSRMGAERKRNRAEKTAWSWSDDWYKDLPRPMFAPAGKDYLGRRKIGRCCNLLAFR